MVSKEKQTTINEKTKNPQKPGIKKDNKLKVYKFELNLKNIGKWFLIGLGILLLLSFFFTPLPQKEIPISQLLQDVKDNKVEQIMVEGDVLQAKYKNEIEAKISRKETLDTIFAIFATTAINPDNVTIDIKDQSALKTWSSLLEIIFPVILTAIIFLFIFRQMRGAQDSVFSFGRSKAKIFMKGKQDVRFADVCGVDEVKHELEEIVDFLKHPKKYQKLGAKTPKGVLLVGPAGTGKTLLARAVAGEAGAPFFSMAGSEFMEMLVGVGASRVRDLFDTAKKMAPSIIFIDEIDAIGRQRGTSISGGHDEREQTLNQILVEMDGFTQRDNVIVLAATNRGDLLDPALLRPGRFDRRVVLHFPDIEGRKHILKIHAKDKPFEKDVDWEKVARRTVGFSGADLENMLNEAAIKAARENKEKISYFDIEEAATKVKMGPEKKRIQSDEDKQITAYHEAGHALCAYFSKHADPVHRISIVSRGQALGYTYTPPEKDKYHETRSELNDMVVMALGGRAAEQVKFKEMTGGAASDIEQVTLIARRMVIDYGMSALGPINLSPQVDRAKYSAAYYPPAEISEKMQAQVDEEIKKIVDINYDKALAILSKHKAKLDLIAQELIKQETLEREEFEKLMKK
ncbi:ATP-dependent zinc metalloprotease FtsH [Candidatus Beckwithbacteria bacterium]|nr:ATP-dependent zinc metalloprotease FtsH [Candidatus Beckwithbacteria bacterium]